VRGAWASCVEAGRLERAAAVPAVADEPDMKLIGKLGRDESLEDLVCGLRRCPRRQQAQPVGDAKDVRIDRKGGPAQGKHEDAGRRFGADSRQRGQPGARLIQRHRGQKREVVAAPLLCNALQYLLDAGGFRR